MSTELREDNACEECGGPVTDGTGSEICGECWSKANYGGGDE